MVVGGFNTRSTKMPMRYPVFDPYTRFSNCVRAETVVDYEEFEAFTVDPGRLEACVAAAIVS